MDSPNNSAGSPIEAPHQTPTTGLDPAQNSPELPGRHPGEGLSVKTPRAVAGHRSTIASSSTEKGAEVHGHTNLDSHPAHRTSPGPDLQPASRHNSCDSVSSDGSYYSHSTPTRTSTASTNITIASMGLHHPETEGVSAHSSASVPAVAGSLKRKGTMEPFLSRATTVESPMPSRTSSLALDSEHDESPSGSNFPLGPFSQNTSASQRSFTLPEQKSSHRHTRRGPSAGHRDSLPIRGALQQRGTFPYAQGPPQQQAGPHSPRRSEQVRLPHPISIQTAFTQPNAMHETTLSATPESENKEWLDAPGTTHVLHMTSLAGGCGVSTRALGETAPERHLEMVNESDSDDPLTDPTTPLAYTPKPEVDTDMLGEAIQEGLGNAQVGDLASRSKPSLSTPSPLLGSSPDGSSSGLDESSSGPDDDKPTDFVCDQVLQQFFGVQLRDLARPQDAWAAVNHLLEELSRLVDNGSDSGYQTAIPTRQRGGPPTGVAPDHGQRGYAPDRNGEDTHRERSYRKRGNPDGNGGDEEDGAGDGKEAGNPKRTKPNNPAQNMKMKYSCPYRKRNPLRFNIRDHLSCATQSFPDMPQLKRHVKTLHARKSTSQFSCQRCKRNFEMYEDLDAHINVPIDRICELRDVLLEDPGNDPEDGINQAMHENLIGRKLNSKIDNWNALWMTLFPGDEVVPDHEFVPPVEWEEVNAEFGESAPLLHMRINENVLNLQFDINSDLKDLVVIKATQACITFIGETLASSKERIGPNRRRQLRQSSTVITAVPPLQELLPSNAVPGLAGGMGGSASIEGSSSVDEPPEPPPASVRGLSGSPGYGGIHPVGSIPSPQPSSTDLLLSGPRLAMSGMQTGGDKGRGVAHVESNSARVHCSVADLPIGRVSSQGAIDMYDDPLWSISNQFNEDRLGDFRTDL